jgi:co-chaperonin GroES (HSP10)|tara:strand:- start:8067 stop:8498 length:432 start_codon:yes stop_codon:yes gene_type:complete
MDATTLGAGPKLKPQLKGTLRPIKDRVLAYNMNFGERKTKGGIIITSDDGQERGIRSRWCQVYAKGPTNKDDYEVGDWIYVDHGRWSRGVMLDEPELGKIEVRLIDTKDVLLMSKEQPEDGVIGTNTDLSQPTIDPSSFVREE